MPGKGPLPIDEALAVAKQIAEALEAAHEQGIIHRDLKPANIKVRPDGAVKVLDFGLAKALDAGVRSCPSVTESPTITAPPLMTGVSAILGSAAYMSPEQAKGRPADKRSDVWAFGCVLYEMLTGERSFDGESASETLARVLEREVDFSRLPAAHPAIVRLLRGAMAKDPRMRLPDTIRNYGISPDGQRFPMVKDESGSGRLNVVLDWFTELNAGVPTK